MAEATIKVVSATKYYDKATEFEIDSKLARLPLVYNRDAKPGENPWEVIGADDLEEGDGTDGYVISCMPWAGIYEVQPFSDMVLNGLGEGELVEVPIVGLIRDLDTWVGGYGGSDS